MREDRRVSVLVSSVTLLKKLKGWGLGMGVVVKGGWGEEKVDDFTPPQRGTVPTRGADTRPGGRRSI